VTATKIAVRFPHRQSSQQKSVAMLARAVRLFQDAREGCDGSNCAAPEHERPLHQIGLDVDQLFENGSESIVDFLETPVDLLESPIDLLKAAVDLLKAVVDLLKAVLDLLNAVVDLLKATVDSVESTEHVVPELVKLCLAPSVVGTYFVQDRHEFRSGIGTERDAQMPGKFSKGSHGSGV
jgi:hypothetical protein